MDKEFKYKAFGMIIKSEFMLPELEIGEGSPDVIIKIAKVPLALENPIESGVCFQASPGEFLFKLDEVAGYYVVDGKEITIQPFSKGNEDAIRLFLLGSVFGALLHQRGYLVIHGSAVEVKGKGIIFTGVSGAGKSTLATAFNEKGYKSLTDDVCALKIEDGIPYIMPGFPSFKLWKDAAEKFNKDTTTLIPIRKELEKYRVECEFCDKPVVVSQIFVLGTHNQESIVVDKVKDFEKIKVLINNTYRLRFLKGQGNKGEHLKQCASLVKYAKINSVVRPKKGFMINEIVSLLEEEMK